MTASSRSTQSRTPPSVAAARALVDPALRAAVETIPDDRMRLIASYQLGWCDAAGEPTDAGGKAIRPTLAVLAAEAVSGHPEHGVPAAVAVELVHNFSLLHDDIMDRDVERRHRPTGWVAFGEGQAILAGNAMLTAAVEVAHRADAAGVALLLDTVQLLIAGQSADLALERRDDATVEDVLAMEGGKTAALIAGAVGLGATGAGAAEAAVKQLYGAGWQVGLAFQLIDDVLGIVGDPSVTGKSASSDVRAGKRSAPVVAALRSGTVAGTELQHLLAGGPPGTDAGVRRAVELIEAAGGIEWAEAEALRLLAEADEAFDAAELPHPAATAQLHELARFLVRRDR